MEALENRHSYDGARRESLRYLGCIDHPSGFPGSPQVNIIAKKPSFNQAKICFGKKQAT